VETHQTKWNPVLRQAVIRVKPDYFALTETEREYYRLNLNTEDDFRIRQTVIKELFGIAVNTTEELDAVLEYPRVSERLANRANLEQGKVNPVREAIRRDIEALEPDWQDYDDFDVDSDFTHIAEQMTALLDAGHADDVVELGELFLRLAPQRYEYSHYDDWDIASGIAGCLDIILEALSRSSLPPAEQLLWYIDAELKDQYGVFDATENFIKKRCYKKADWRAVADVLEKRLQTKPVPGNDATRPGHYQRNKLSRWLQTVLEKIGRQTDIIELLQREAPITHRYDEEVVPPGQEKSLEPQHG